MQKGLLTAIALLAFAPGSAFSQLATTTSLVGNVTDSIVKAVIVQAEVAAVRTDDATISAVFGTRAVAELPLNCRDPMMLAVTTPGALLGSKSSMTGIPPGNDYVGAGTREIQNSMSLNGIITLRGGLPFNVSTGTDTANTSSFGNITGASGNRNIQLGAKLSF